MSKKSVNFAAKFVSLPQKVLKTGEWGRRNELKDNEKTIITLNNSSEDYRIFNLKNYETDSH